MSKSTTYLLGIAITTFTVLFLVLGIGALGIVGDGGAPDRWYALVLGVGLVGSVLARLRSPGMAATTIAMAATQLVVTIGAIVAVLLDVEDFAGASVVDLVAINTMYAALFLAAGWFFRRAATGTAAGAAVSRG